MSKKEILLKEIEEVPEPLKEYLGQASQFHIVGAYLNLLLSLLLGLVHF